MRQKMERKRRAAFPLPGQREKSFLRKGAQRTRMKALEEKILSEGTVLPGNVLRLYDFLERPQVVAATLAETKAALLGLESRSANLEDYFLSLIGGVHHG